MLVVCLAFAASEVAPLLPPSLPPSLPYLPRHSTVQSYPPSSSVYSPLVENYKTPHPAPSSSPAISRENRRLLLLGKPQGTDGGRAGGISPRGNNVLLRLGLARGHGRGGGCSLPKEWPCLQRPSSRDAIGIREGVVLVAAVAVGRSARGFVGSLRGGEQGAVLLSKGEGGREIDECQHLISTS